MEENALGMVMPEDMDLEKWAHQQRKAYLVESIPENGLVESLVEVPSLLMALRWIHKVGLLIRYFIRSRTQKIPIPSLVAISNSKPRDREKDGSVRGCLAVLAGYWEEEIGWWMGEQ